MVVPFWHKFFLAANTVGQLSCCASLTEAGLITCLPNPAKGAVSRVGAKLTTRQYPGLDCLKFPAANNTRQGPAFFPWVARAAARFYILGIPADQLGERTCHHIRKLKTFKPKTAICGFSCICRQKQAKFFLFCLFPFPDRSCPIILGDNCRVM